MTSVEAARRHLEAIAREARPAGGRAEARAREYCAAVLRDAGFDVGEESFTYSAFPGTLATPVFGIFSLIVFLAALALAQRNEPWRALTALVMGAIPMALGGVWLARQGVSRLRLMRRSGVNLVARRGALDPPVWLMAHLDSKSQPVPMLLRAGGITVTALVWLATPALLTVQGMGLAGRGWISWMAGVGIVSAVPIAVSLVGARSPGAVDNASGVVAVLLAAEADQTLPLGVVLTSAEELGLAGARGWAVRHQAGLAINCDGVDDAGALAAMYSGPAPRRLLEAFAKAAEQGGVAARTHRVLPGVLVDGVALADAGWDVITISRGTVGTLRRIHTPEDSLDTMTGRGIPDAARVMTIIAREFGR